MTPAIHALTQTEARDIDRLHGSWALWHAIGRRLGVEFRPESGPICSVERTGWLSIAVTWAPRKCCKPPSEVELVRDFYVMPRHQSRLP